MRKSKESRFKIVKTPHFRQDVFIKVNYFKLLIMQSFSRSKNFKKGAANLYNRAPLIKKRQH